MDLLSALRLEPFFVAAAAANPEVSQRLLETVEHLRSYRTALIHGDVSPKNILIHISRPPVLLDAECACWADPAFDVAFLAAHLLLKASHMSSFRDWFYETIKRLVDAYEPVAPEPVSERLCSAGARIAARARRRQIAGRISESQGARESARERVAVPADAADVVHAIRQRLASGVFSMMRSDAKPIRQSHARSTTRAAARRSKWNCAPAPRADAASRRPAHPKGAHEIGERRDADGYGVNDACRAFRDVVAPALKGMDCRDARRHRRAPDRTRRRAAAAASAATR